MKSTLFRLYKTGVLSLMASYFSWHVELTQLVNKMSHYARLAAVGFRFLAVAALLHWIPGIFVGLGVTGMTGMPQPPAWAVASVSFYPIMAVILFLVARPLGQFVARGLE